MRHAKSFGDSVSPPFRIHAGAMTFDIFHANQTTFIKRQRSSKRKGAANERRLIEAALTLAFSMQRHRNDSRRSIQRRPPLRANQCFGQLSAKVRFAFELEN